MSNVTMPNLTIIYKDNVISPETFTDRFEEFQLKREYSKMHSKQTALDLLAFLNSYEV